MTKILIPIFLILASCATVPQTSLPPWLETPAAIRTVYPDSRYIAQQGRGKTLEAAETAAAAELARFITSRVDSAQGFSITTNQNGSETNETASTINEAYIKTQMNLFGIRYAADPYYDARAREWRTVAYIERDEAWGIYEPSFKRQAESFLNLYKAAADETGAFKKVMRFQAVVKYALQDDFENANLFGQILYPAKMNSEFAGVREALASIPKEMDSAKRNASVFIDCSADFESLIANSFSQCFSTEGFAVSKNADSAGAVCAVTVTDGKQQGDSGYYYYPSLQAIVSDASGVLWTFNAEAGKQAAISADVAKRRAYTALADEVNKTFANQFSANGL
jgi:hypothetical protein